MKSPATLQVTFPFGQTLALAAALMLLLVGAAEWIARQPSVARQVPGAVGSQNAVFDVKIGALDRLVAQKGPVDCLFVGSSVVLMGLDPAVFEQAYQAQTGDELVCYNFGVPALTARSTGVLAALLAERYHPRLLVYGFTLRDLSGSAADAEHVYRWIVDTPWVQYQRGSFTVQGWLVDHLVSYRRYLAFRNWMRADYRTADVLHPPPDGYQPFKPTRPYDPATIQPPDYFTDYAISPAEWAGMQQVIALQPSTQVLLVEMPLPAFYLDFFPGGAEGYDSLIDRVGHYARERSVPLWKTSPLHLIPDDGWAEDAHHVNARGAQLLSAWLGQQVGDAMNAGQLIPPAH